MCSLQSYNRLSNDWVNVKWKFTDDAAESISDTNNAERVEAETKDQAKRFRHELLENQNRRNSGFERLAEKFRQV